MTLKNSKKLTQITEREKVFYDGIWSASELRVIKEPIDMGGVVELKDKRILICGCGVGVEAVRAARAGAKVHAFDLSPVAVDRTRQLASVNDVAVSASVMDFHHLDYPDDFFDVAYGAYILHHVDCELAGRELFRVLKPGGIAYFLENSGANPLVMWARRMLFGRPGTIHRQRFLFVKRMGSVDEDPLSAHEISVLKEIFGGNISVKHPDFMFFRLVARHMISNPVSRRIMVSLDRSIASLAPWLKKYSFSQSIWLRKPSPGLMDGKPMVSDSD